MSGSLFSRVTFLILCGVLICAVSGLAVASVAATEQGGRVISGGVPNGIGMALDNRGNMYMADGERGHVYCLPPESQPVLFAKVQGHPASLAVDRQGNVFVGTQEGVVYMVSLDGTVQAVYQCNAEAVALEIDRDGGLIVAMEGGAVVRVRRNELRIR